MNKKLLLLLLAGATMFMLPACGDDDDDDDAKKENNVSGDDDNKQPSDSTNNQPSETLAFSEVYGTYQGYLDETINNTLFADSIGVTVGKDEKDNCVTLALEPISISGIMIDNLSFTGIPCTYNAADDSWDFSAEKLQVSLLGGALTAVVDINEGKFTKGGTLNFEIFVDAGMVQLPLVYAGNK